jgi:inorganic triphosphatase YgiF
MERELKLQLADGQTAQLRESALLASLQTEPPHAEELVSTYFDTPDLALHRLGASLRVRTAGDHHVQTLKTAGRVRAGLYERGEYEVPVADGKPNLAALRGHLPKSSDLGKLLRGGGLADRLAPIFVTRVNRSISLLRLPKGDEIELAVDEGVVQAGEASSPIHEVEMELKSGAPEHLYRFALDLLDDVPLRPGYLSKSDRGYELIVQEHREPVRAEPLALSKRDTVEQAFQRMVENCLAQVHGNERGVVSGNDAGSVHQMRVGLRRLRSAADLVAPVIPFPAELEKEIRWIAGELGDARDWHVLASATLPEVAGAAPEDTDVAAVELASEETARANRERAAAAVDSARYTRLMMALSGWLEQRGWREGMGPEERQALSTPVRKFASKTLRERRRKLLKRGRRMSRLDPHERHRARIAAKKLRYATEFFACLYPDKAVRRFASALGKLQDDLGWRNDVAVADGLLKTLAAERPETGPGVGFARGYLASRVAADDDALRRMWKRFKRQPLPR